MNKNYTSIIVLVTILFFGALSAQETQKNFINYQGVARNAENQLMAGEAMTIGVALKFGIASASSVYEESHAITTDANGVFSLLIGNGSSLRGDYNALPWGSAATFITVSMNGSEVGTTEMMAVPYAISSGDADDQSAAEVFYDNAASGLSATTAQEAIDELMTGGRVDADPDPSNEFQLLSFDAGTNELSLSDGNTISIPTGGTDADADPTNEIQTISFDAASNKISLTDGGEITIPSGGTDADADPTNEIQTISFDVGTNELSLSDGGVVTIPSGGTDADADPTNEIQDISLAGTELTISDGSTIDLAPIVPSGGTDNQELTFNETTKILEIEDGNTVDLSSLSGGGGSSLWTEDEEGISRRTGVVGIGHQASLNAKLFVQNAIEGIRNGIASSVFNPGFKVGISSSARSNDDELTFGMRSNVESNAGATSYAYRADMNGAGTGTKYAFFSRIHAGAGEKYGLYTDGEDKNYFSGDLGIGTEIPTAKLDVAGDIRSRILSGTGQRNVMADANGNLIVGAGGGVTSINDLDDAKSDTGADSGSSIFLGRGSGMADDGTSNRNTGIGRWSLTRNIDGESNVAIGGQSLPKNINGSFNVAIGGGSLADNTGGSNNTSLGVGAMVKNTVGNLNSATGRFALWNNSNGNNNTANGYFALHDNNNGNFNTAMGSRALHQVNGSWNTAVGNDALNNLLTGNNNIGIGADSRVPNANGSSQVRIGNTQITYAGVQVAWTVTSDVRWKEEVQNLSYGLNMVSQLRPVDYVRKNNQHNTREIGFIAQEVEEVLAQLGYKNQGILTKDDDGYMSLRYNDFIPVLTKAVQEQQEMITSLQNEQENIQSQLAALKNQVAELVNFQDKKEALLEK